MSNRGRPRHPDILTPREWEVLALIREGLSNPEIASRLGITLDGTEYHVSEILSKLGMSSRQEAAAWEPDERERRAWWLAAVAPLLFWRKLRLGWLSAGVAVVAVAAGLGLLAWGLVRTQEEGSPELAVVSEPGVYLIKPDGSGLRRLPGAGRARDAFAWAPSGNRFALAPGCQAEHELLLGAANDQHLEKLASLGSDAYLQWSPTGDTISVTLRSRDDVPGAVLLVDIDRRDVTPVEDAIRSYGWSYDGRRYAVSREGTTTIVDTATGRRTDLGERVERVLWSPTDDRLALTYTLGPDEPPYHAWLASGVDIANGDGTGRRVILPAERHTLTGYAYPLAWSPDGTRLLVKPGTSPFRLLVYDVDAPEQPADLGQTYKLSGASWSPTGEHIAVGRSGTPDLEVFIEVLPADGGPGIEVTAGYVTRYPQFSPDGEQLAFLARGPGTDAADLYLTKADGGEPRMLASVGMTIFDVAWSADGTYIAFTAGLVTSDGCGLF